MLGARLRGYDVRALPNNRNGYIKDLARDTKLAYKGNVQQVRKSRGENIKSFLLKNIKDNERYNIEWTYNNRRYGHIVSIQKKGNDIMIYDPQVGSIVKGIDNCTKYLQRGKNHMITRVDNAVFNNDYVDYILKGRSLK